MKIRTKLLSALFAVIVIFVVGNVYAEIETVVEQIRQVSVAAKYLDSGTVQAVESISGSVS